MFLCYQDRRELFDKENLQPYAIQRSISSNIISATFFFSWLFLLTKTHELLNLQSPELWSL